MFSLKLIDIFLFTKYQITYDDHLAQPKVKYKYSTWIPEGNKNMWVLLLSSFVCVPAVCEL